MKETADNSRDDLQWQRFAALADEYCKIIEAVRGADVADLKVIRGTLLKLYAAACELPEVAEPAVQPVSISHDRSLALYTRLVEHFGERDLYWDAFDPPIKDDNDPLGNSLADDLADIWRDLKSGLELSPDASAEAVCGARWEWRFAFEIHWGAHAIGALRALHYLLLQDI